MTFIDLRPIFTEISASMLCISGSFVYSHIVDTVDVCQEEQCRQTRGGRG